MKIRDGFRTIISRFQFSQQNIGPFDFAVATKSPALTACLRDTLAAGEVGKLMLESAGEGGYKGRGRGWLKNNNNIGDNIAVSNRSLNLKTICTDLEENREDKNEMDFNTLH